MDDVAEGIVPGEEEIEQVRQVFIFGRYSRPSGDRQDALREFGDNLIGNIQRF